MATPSIITLIQQFSGVFLNESVLTPSSVGKFDHWLDAVLTPRKAKVIRLSYGIGTERKTAGGVGREFDVTAERITQIKVNALRALKKAFQQNLPGSIPEEIRHLSLVNDSGKLSEELERLRVRNNFLEKRLVQLEGLIRTLHQDAFAKTTTSLLADDDPVDKLGLTVRSENGLKAENIFTIGELCSKTVVDLLRIPNFGKKSLTEVRDTMENFGLTLKES